MHAYFYFLFPLKKAPRKKKTPSPKRLFNRAPIPGGYLQSSESMRQHVSLLYKGQLFFPPPPLAAIGNYITTRKAKRPDRRLKKKNLSQVTRFDLFSTSLDPYNSRSSRERRKHQTLWRMRFSCSINGNYFSFLSEITALRYYSLRSAPLSLSYIWMYILDYKRTLSFLKVNTNMSSEILWRRFFRAVARSNKKKGKKKTKRKIEFEHVINAAGIGLHILKEEEEEGE